MGRLAFLAETACVVRMILQEEASPRRKELLRGYLKLRCKLTRLKRLFRSTPNQERLFGYDMRYLHFHTLLYLFEEIFLYKHYVFQADSDAPKIIDCGSNIGLSVLFFKQLYPKATIVAFEPDPETCEVLRANIAQNGLHGVEVHNKALQPCQGPVELYCDPKLPGALRMSTVKGRWGNVPRQVEGVRLSDYVDGPVDYLKMDIEGSECAVLEELARAGKLGCIKQMLVEYHHHVPPGHDALSTMLRLLEENGFGYQVAAGASRPFQPDSFQDIHLYAYQK